MMAPMKAMSTTLRAFMCTPKKWIWAHNLAGGGHQEIRPDSELTQSRRDQLLFRETMASPTYRLETLGTVVLSGPHRAIRAADQRQQRRRLGLLAVLASAGERGVSRDQLLLFFWPESTQKKARHSLDQLLYAIRTSLGESVFLGTNPIRLNPEALGADVCDFNANIARGDLEAAAASYTGAFLDGFYLSDTREFEEWAERERRRLTQAYLNTLEQLALLSQRKGDFAGAVHWRRKLSEADPVSSRYALSLMNALAEAGDIPAAIAFGERYQRDVVETLGTAGSADVAKLVSQLRNTPARRSELTSLSIPPGEAAPKPRTSRSRAATYIMLAGVAAIAVGSTFLSGGNQQPSNRAARGTANLAAYDLYVRGRDQVAMRNDSTTRLALNYFRQAAELDPGFAAAYAGLATMYTRLAMSNNPGLPRSELRQRATAAAQTAISLDESLAEAHVALGLINSYWLVDFNLAESELERALSLNPREPHAREYLALALVFLGRPRDALNQIQRAVADDPLSPTARATLALVQYILGRCDLASRALDSLAAMKPPLLRVAVTRSLCFASHGDWANAASAVRAPADAGGVRAMGLVGFALARNGDAADALALRTKLRDIAATNPAAWFDASVVSFGLGDTDASFAELRRSVDAGILPWEVMGPVFDEWRRDPRFVEIAAAKGVRLYSR